MSVLGSVIPVRTQFLDKLVTLDSFTLEGSLLMDLSIIANIPAIAISELNYGDISVSGTINQFESKAAVGSAPIYLDLPITLPFGDGEIINFAITAASFSRDVFVKARGPIDIAYLFSDHQADASLSLDYGGTFEAILPLTVGVADVDIDVILAINDTNVFQPDPVVSHYIDLCQVSAAMMDLFEQMKTKIVEAVRAPFGDKPVMVCILHPMLYYLASSFALTFHTFHFKFSLTSIG
jgi:hypothetical protein